MVVQLHADRSSVSVVHIDQFLSMYGKKFAGDVVDVTALIQGYKAKGHMACAYTTDDAFKISYVDNSLAPVDCSWSASFDDIEKQLENAGAISMLLSICMSFGVDSEQGIERIAKSFFLIDGKLVLKNVIVCIGLSCHHFRLLITL